MESSYFNYDFLDLDKTNLPKFNYYLDSENVFYV